MTDLLCCSCFRAVGLPVLLGGASFLEEWSEPEQVSEFMVVGLTFLSLMTNNSKYAEFFLKSAFPSLLPFSSESFFFSFAQVSI